MKARIDTLATDIRNAPAPDADLKKSLVGLRSAIDALEAKASDDAAVFASRVDEIVPIATKLKTSPTLPLAAKASELIAAVQPLELADPTRTAIARAKALSDALPGVISTYPPLREAINALFTPLERIEEVNFLESIVRRSGSLSTLLTKGGAGPPTSLDAINSLTTLDTAILAYRKHADPMVDIVYAEYGDMRDHTSPPRGGRPQLCDATDAMRKQCQGHQSCTAPAFATLCPVDPGELVATENKGVWVLFRCVDPLLNVYAPPALAGMVPNRGNSTWVPLRNTTEEFRCAPAKPVTQAQN